MAADKPNPPATNAEARDLMQRFLHAYTHSMPASNFDAAFSRLATCTSATLQTPTAPARSTFAFTIPDQYSNNPIDPSIHGGAVATFFDNLTSMTLLAAQTSPPEAWWSHTGVTRNLNVTYFRPPAKGERVVVESEVAQVGKRSATITGKLLRESDGKVLAICVHEKVNPERKVSSLGKL